LEKPHWGKSLEPFMKRRTECDSTRVWIRSLTELEEMSSSSSDMCKLVDDENADAAAGAGAAGVANLCLWATEE